MTIYRFPASLMAFKCWVRSSSGRAKHARHLGRFVHRKGDAADLQQTQLDEVANVPIEGGLNDLEGDGESLLDSGLREGIGPSAPWGQSATGCRFPVNPHGYR
jgi:hypothetical protein